MDAGSVVSEPISAHHRAFAKQKSASMTILNHRSNKYSTHNDNKNVDTKMSDAEANLINSAQTQTATTGRRRKVSSLGGTLSARSCRSETKELRSALQDREAVIQNLRIQLCLGKLPRPSGPPLDDSEKPAAEQKLQRLKAEAENKKIKIKNLKSALEKLDITDNIDIRIRQAELEYALGREELQMLSIVEEARALQARLEKSKPELQTIYNILNSGATLSLHAVHATTGRWAAHTKPDQPGFYVEWALEGDGLYKGDRILEVNGKMIACRTKEELQKVIGNSGKCQIVVLRKKCAPIPQKQLDQEKENNMRLQHRISYLEEQVRELQTAKEQPQQQQPQAMPQTPQNQTTAAHINNGTNSHVTSISISSPPSTPPDNKPLIFQRGNYITTLVGGKPIELIGENNTQNALSKSNSVAHVTKTLIKENTQLDLHQERTPRACAPPAYTCMPPKSLSASKISINSDSAYMQHTHYRRSEKERHARERERERYERSTSKASALQHRANMHARSVEHLNHYNGMERRRDCSATANTQSRVPADMRSVKSLDFDSDNESKPISDTISEVRAVRPTPPKKPLRLSLQRAQSLQTVELTPNCDAERKRPMKRAHINDKSPADRETAMLFENCNPLQTASLGRPRANI
uniref:PDZ domain-containing protein n=1 Tax=Bactrocera latifrons TaxID=174628 RepID=A0A0K8U2H0_BACLA